MTGIPSDADVKRTAEIVSISPDIEYAPRHLGQPVPEIVELLEQALASAKSGDMRAFALAYVIEDGTEAKIMNHCRHIEPTYWRTMFMEISRLHKRFMDDL